VKKVNVTYKGWAWGWGIFLLLVAALVLFDQLGGFIDLGIWSIIVAALAVAFMVKCIIDLSFGSLPIPIAALYYIFQTPLELPNIDFWPLVLVTVLATAGLSALIPPKIFRRHMRRHRGSDWQKDKYRRKYGGKDIVEEIIVDIQDEAENLEGAIEGFAAEIEDAVDGAAERNGYHHSSRVEEGGSDNNPRISVMFNGVSRYLRADSLETVDLDCSFGALEVYFDHVELSPNGAEAFLSCKFGAIELYVPSHWRILDNMSASIGGVDIKNRRHEPDENAPVLKVSGNVSFGGVEVHRV